MQESLYNSLIHLLISTLQSRFKSIFSFTSLKEASISFKNKLNRKLKLLFTSLSLILGFNKGFLYSLNSRVKSSWCKETIVSFLFDSENEVDSFSLFSINP